MSDETLTPITREETYLAAIAGEDVTVPDPVTRHEEFLAAIDGHVDSVEQDVTDLAAIVPTPAALDEGKVLTAGSTAGTASWANVPKELPASLGTAGQVLTVNAGATGVEWATPSGGGAAPVTVTNADFISDISSFLTALITASTDTATRIKIGDTMTGDEELFEAFKSIHENGNPLDITISGYTFRMYPVLSRTATIGSEVFYYVQLVNERFQYMNNYKLGYDINVSKSPYAYHYELAMTCVKMTVLT